MPPRKIAPYDRCGIPQNLHHRSLANLQGYPWHIPHLNILLGSPSRLSENAEAFMSGFRLELVLYATPGNSTLVGTWL